MRKKRIIVAGSVIAGFSLSIFILYPFLVEDYKKIPGILIMVGSAVNAIIIGVVVVSKIKENS